jgi:hypothetical protein
MTQLQLMKDLAASIKVISVTLDNFVKEQESGKVEVGATPPVEDRNATVPEEKKAVITVEKVRAVLAELSRNGHQPEVKALITKYGADKLTALNPDCFEELLKEAEAI